MGNIGHEDEPVSPAGRLFLQPQMQTVINCVLGFKFVVDIEAVKEEIRTSSMLQHPRFSSIMVHDRDGIEHWRRTQVDLEKHVIVVPEEESSSSEGEEFVNDYIANLCVSCPLDPEKPLWEVHVLKTNKCCVLRFHHSLGDGTSLMSLMLSLCRRVDNPDLLPTVPSSKTPVTRGRITSPSSFLNWVFGQILILFFTLLYIVDFILHIFCVKDKKTVISGGAGVELWPRKFVTVTFSIDDMKTVKKAVNGTINDVLFGIITCGFAKYLELRSERLEGHRMTGLALVNTRPRPGLQDVSSMMRDDSKSKWGNKFAYVLLPVYLEKHSNPLEYVKAVKTMLDRKKRSLEALFCYYSGVLVMSIFGPKVATWINYRVVANTTFTVSNVLGAQEEIMFAGNPITYVHATTTSIPHAITMHMVSYMGRADLQILVAKDIIPDPQILSKCFADALHQMKEAAEAEKSH